MRISLLLTFFMGAFLPVTCLLAQKKSDPALKLYFAANAAYNRKLYPIAAGNYQKFLSACPTYKQAGHYWGLRAEI